MTQNGKTNEPVGYGHDQKGAAVGDAKNQGRPHVVQQPADRVDGPATIKFTLDGQEVEAPEGETICRSARRYGIELPHLCYTPKPGYRPDGNCRVCMVEIEGERVLAASCLRKAAPGMKVKTQTERAKTARRMVVELLMADQPAREVAHDPESEFWQTATRLGVETSRFPQRAAPAPIAAIPPWRSTSMPASSAICASAPAARCRSTTSSAWPAAASARRSCSTSTIRWAPRPASPAASAYRPARPAR